MKKLLVLALVLGMLASTVAPVLAAGGPPGGKGSGGNVGKSGNSLFALVGTIASLDVTARTVTVTVVSGNKLVKTYIQQNLILQTNDSTIFLLRNPDGTTTPITFANLVVGQKVSASGKSTTGGWVTSRITVGAELNCQP